MRGKVIPDKMKQDVDRLWMSRQTLIRKETLTDDDVRKLQMLTQETVDLSGRIRLLVRDKENYTDEDVSNHARDINNLQLMFHGIVEIWTKVKNPERDKFKVSVMSDMMELATDVSSVYGEVMSLFLQRFGLDIIPLMRPIHGLFYSLSIHCRYHCPELVARDRHELRDLYNSFLTGVLGFLRSAKILLKRLRFDQDVAYQRRRLVQSNISALITELHLMVTSSGKHSPDEYVTAIEKCGSLCTDVFFTIGKTSGISDVLELGEGVVATEPAECLGEIAHSDVNRCTIEQRPVVLQGLQLQNGGRFVSDLYVLSGSQFLPTNKVMVTLPFSGTPFSPAALLKVKLKVGQTWYDTPGEMKDGHIEFSTKFMNAFIVVVEFVSLIKEIPPSGGNYTCKEDPRIRVNFPEGCFQKPTSFDFRVIQINRARMFDYKDHCPKVCRTILAISDYLCIIGEEEPAFLAPVMVHLPIPNDIDDPDSEIVLFRAREDGEIELIPKRSAMICPSTGNCYTFQVQSFSGIALGKVKKKHLRRNKSAVIDEYDLYMEEAYMCNILTFLDKSLLHVGMVKLYVECCEKRFVKKALRRRAKEGLFEVPGSRSPDIRLMNQDIICIETEGNIQRMKEVPLQNYFIVFLSSGRDNWRSFPVEPRNDPEGRAYGMLNFYKDNELDQKFLHSAVVDSNRYLLGAATARMTTAPPRNRTDHGLETPRTPRTPWSSRPSTTSKKEGTAFRAIFDEFPVLSHQSILSLSSFLTLELLQMICYELGISYDQILSLRLSTQLPVMLNYEVLWRWRGKTPSKDMVRELIQAFKACNQFKIAEAITKANKEKRALRKEDFK